jgi:hypothetical protein
VQLKSITKATHAGAFGNALIDDMKDFAKRVKERSGIEATLGLLSPANRFLSDTSVPECTRYSVPAKVSDYSPGASVEQLQLIARAKELQAAKRARLS